MGCDYTTSQNEYHYDLHSIYPLDNPTADVLCHSLSIDHGDSLVVNVWHHSQTVVVTN